MRAAVTHLDLERLAAATGRPASEFVAWLSSDEVDMTGGVLRHLPYSVPLGAWVHQNRPHFQPARVEIPERARHDDIGGALTQGTTCLRCIAAAHQVSLRHVVDELRRLSRDAEVIIGEDTCRSCRQHRAIFTVTSVAGCVSCAEH